MKICDVIVQSRLCGVLLFFQRRNGRIKNSKRDSAMFFLLLGSPDTHLIVLLGLGSRYVRTICRMLFLVTTPAAAPSWTWERYCEKETLDTAADHQDLTTDKDSTAGKNKTSAGSTIVHSFIKE